MLASTILPLEPKSPWLTQIAIEQFQHWGPLTGHSTSSSYQSFLEQAAQSAALPRVLIAAIRGTLLGSVNLLSSEMTIRPQFTPWMGQLFVVENSRFQGIGVKLLDAAVSYVGRLGYRQIFLFTAGTLLHYYRNRGWMDVEDVVYLGKLKTVMRYEIERAS